jgi:ribonuclease Z
MMRIVFLGTAGSTPTKFRGLPSIAIEHNSEIYLFDCGEGTQRQMMQCGLNISRIKTIFLTHVHGDHTLGIAGLIRTLALNRRTSPLEIYIPKGGEAVVNQLINFDKVVLNYKIMIKPIKQGEVYKGRDFTVSAFKLVHTTNTYGFVFKENDGIRFIKPKIKNLGIKGKMFGTLIKNKSIKIGNKKIKLSDVSFKKIGKKIVYATDTRPTNETIKAAKDADVLIHESTYADKEIILAKQRKHSTSNESANIAKRAKAKRLILTHPSARYKNSETLLIQARKAFKSTEMAKDGMIIEL